MDIDVRALTPDLLADYLAYFDHTAFTDNPEWAGCYCYFYLRDPQREDWNTRSGEQNRASVAALISAGAMQGYLAYVDGAVAGWCHAAPRSFFPIFANDADLGDTDPGTTGAIVCFNVAPGRRRQGIASALLDAAVRGLTDRGMALAEAYPGKGGATTDAGHYHGPLEMYLRAGFAVVRELESCFVVRKSLA